MSRYPKCRACKLPVIESLHKTPVVERFHLLLAINNMEDLSANDFKNLKWFPVEEKKCYLAWDVELILERKLADKRKKKLTKILTKKLTNPFK